MKKTYKYAVIGVLSCFWQVAKTFWISVKTPAV